MMPFAARLRCLLATTGLLLLTAPAVRAEKPSQPAIDFNRHIRPILSDNCFACHGPDEKQRKARFRLDTRDGAFAQLRSEGHAIVAGKPAESELLERINSDDPGLHMPPAKSGKHLTTQQVALLRQWIEQGAPWSSHWAYVAPRRPALPKVADASWPRNPVDHFILARLEAERLRPSPEANKTILLRRVTLDLTGLPPTPAEVDAFLADQSPDAYEKVVDRLLQSPHYGEHLARFWLDVARYGDTHGLHLDNYREIWPYRDWVIKAFNDNKSFDRFVVEQLAGDLLPEPTRDQIVATGFDRCNVTTSEGGSIEEEVRVRNVVDRVDTTGTVFLGLTVGCARCHDHKFDPVRQKDYYQLFAYFNSIDGKPLDGNAAQHPPVLKVPTAEQTAALERLQQKTEAIQKAIAAEVAKVKYDEADEGKEPERAERADYVWLDDDLPAGAKPQPASGANAGWTFVTKPAHPVFSGTKSVERKAEGVSQVVLQEASPGLVIGAGDTLFTYVYLDPAKLPRQVMLQWHTNGWEHRAYWGENLIPFGKDKTTARHQVGTLPKAGEWIRLEVEAAKVGLTPGMVVNGLAFTQHGGHVYWDRAGLITRTPQGNQPFHTLTAWLRMQQAIGGSGLPKDLQEILKTEPGKRTDAQKKQLRDHFIEHARAKTRPLFEPLHRQLSEVEKERAKVEKELPATLVFKEAATPRPAHILKRGEYDQPGELVGRDTPAFLPPLPADAPHNRLGLARWLVDPNHPLTARVAVNRFWQQCFGTGLVKTAEDFGSQGEPPSHPELLDFLAVQFREDGWDVKRTVRRIVTSATYRQSSHLTPDRLAKDPANRLLSRGPRFRLDAEMLRDQALAVSGLLVEKVGGPSVKPPQPSGLWEAVGYVTSNTARFSADAGHEKVHRRSLYTFWKRTAPPPQMSAFDAPSREACTVRRERTNTPLQALLLLNETQYIEAARALAERTIREGGNKPEARLAFLFKLTAARSPDAKELAELTALYKDNLATFTRDVEGAKKLIAVGETRPDANLNPSELAAWTMLGNLILNLDEVINKN